MYIQMKLLRVIITLDKVRFKNQRTLFLFFKKANIFYHNNISILYNLHVFVYILKVYNL